MFFDCYKIDNKYYTISNKFSVIVHNRKAEKEGEYHFRKCLPGFAPSDFSSYLSYDKAHIYIRCYKYFIDFDVKLRNFSLKFIYHDYINYGCGSFNFTSNGYFVVNIYNNLVIYGPKKINIGSIDGNFYVHDNYIYYTQTILHRLDTISNMIDKIYEPHICGGMYQDLNYIILPLQNGRTRIYDLDLEVVGEYIGGHAMSGNLIINTTKTLQVFDYVNNKHLFGFKTDLPNKPEINLADELIVISCKMSQNYHQLIIYNKKYGLLDILYHKICPDEIIGASEDGFQLYLHDKNSDIYTYDIHSLYAKVQFKQFLKGTLDKRSPVYRFKNNEIYDRHLQGEIYSFLGFKKSLS